MNAASPRRTALLASTVVLLGSCTEAAETADFRLETRDGISHSIAADRPEREESTLELLWEAPPADELMDGANWANPTQLAADEDGVAVLDPQLSLVHLLNVDGERERSIGGSGEGPGELSNPRQLALHGDTIIIHDAGRPALQLFSRGGAYVGDFDAIEGISFGFHYVSTGGVLRSGMAPTEGRVEPSWTYTTLDGVRTPVENTGNHPLQPQVAEGEDGCWRRAGVGPNIVEVDCTFPLVRVVDPMGAVLREHRIDRLPVRATEEELDAIAESVTSVMQSGSALPPALIEQTVNQEVERNRWAPANRAIAGSPSGHRIVIWEELPASFGEHDAILHILDGEGRYLVRAEPGAALQAVAVTDRRIYVLARDPETDLRKLQAFRLP